MNPNDERSVDWQQWDKELQPKFMSGKRGNYTPESQPSSDPPPITFGTDNRLIVDDETGEPLLAAGATWEYIQSSELFRQGIVDVGDVCETLKRSARDDGKGPVFRESDIRRAIEESARAGERDELI